MKDFGIPDSLREDLEKQNYGYDYPKKLDLHPKSKLHKFIVQQVNERAKMARTLTDTVKSEWRQIDHVSTAYVPLNDKELKQADSRRPIGVVVPMMFAHEQVYCTYMDAVHSTPYHRYSGRGSARAKASAALMERVIGTQNVWFKEGLALSTQHRDSFRYGLGIVSPTWSKHKARKAIAEPVTALLEEALRELKLGAKRGDVIRYLREQVVFEGNKLINIDPYQALLDPNTPINDIQHAEFFGYMQSGHIMDLLKREIDPEERRFNGKYLRHVVETGSGASQYWLDESGRKEKTGTESNARNMNTYSGAFHETHLHLDLIPSEWKIGDEDYPVRWCFVVAADCIVISAYELDYDHGMYPVAVSAPNTTGYDVIPVGYASIAYGTDWMANWMIRSHFDNVAKSLNDMFVIDGSRIEEEDMLNPEPGKLIRLKQSAYGSQNIDSFIKQLNVTDVTRTHVNDANLFIEYSKQALGTVDALSGDFSGMPERPGAQGIQQARNGAFSRFRRIAQIIGMQSMRDIAWQEAYNTIQFMDQEVAVSILGKYASDIRKEFGVEESGTEYSVSPFDLEPNFEVMPHDGSLPDMNSDTQAMGQAMQMLMQVEGVPQTIMQGLDIIPMYLQFMRKSGFEDVHEFIRETGGVQASVMPDEQVAQQVQQGNMVPMSEYAA